MDRGTNTDANTLTLLPCTMKNGRFVTNLKWIFTKFRPIFHYQFRPYYSRQLRVYNPIKDEYEMIQLRLSKQPNNKRGTYQIDYWQNPRDYCETPGWTWYSSIDVRDENYEYIVCCLNDVYYSSKALDKDLQKYLAPIHGKAFSYGGNTHSLQLCPLQTLLAFIGQEYNEDFVIQCEEQEFKIKKIILRARSPVFDAMFSSNFKEVRENRMIIKDYAPEVVEKMVEYFQTDFVKETSNYEIELYKIARKYISESFMEFTKLILVQKLTMENYDELLEIVRKHSDKETEELMNEWYLQIKRSRLFKDYFSLC